MTLMPSDSCPACGQPLPRRAELADHTLDELLAAYRGVMYRFSVRPELAATLPPRRLPFPGDPA